jgi:diacylglycerol O-acyltransferase
MSEFRFDRMMSDAEGLMWRLEQDPHLSSTFGTVTLLDRAPDFASFRRRMEYVVTAVPRLRQRVVTNPGGLGPPTWVDDPHFDIDRHVRRIACPKPGTLRQVLDLASQFVADPLDPARPLWQFVVVEGMRGGKAALLQKMHHTITDGERGVELSMQFYDLERDAPDPAPVEPAAPTGHHEPHPPSTADTIAEVIAGSMRLPIGIAKRVRDLLADPAGLPDATGHAAKTLRGVVSELSDTLPARSPLWTERSLHRRLEVASAPLDETKRAAERLGGTLNTAFVTAAAHAAADYHCEMGTPVESLRATMAISTRTDGSGSNAFSMARILVPTDTMPIAERFRAIHETARMALEANKSAALETLATVTSVLPGSLITRLAQQQARTIDFATSNVKGAPFPLFTAGAEVIQIYPIGPVIGTAFNLTLLSYRGRLDMGINIDTAAVTEPDRLTKCLQRSFAELARA